VKLALPRGCVAAHGKSKTRQPTTGTYQARTCLSIIRRSPLEDVSVHFYIAFGSSDGNLSTNRRRASVIAPADFAVVKISTQKIIIRVRLGSDFDYVTSGGSVSRSVAVEFVRYTVQLLLGVHAGSSELLDSRVVRCNAENDTADRRPAHAAAIRAYSMTACRLLTGDGRAR